MALLICTCMYTFKFKSNWLILFTHFLFWKELIFTVGATLMHIIAFIVLLAGFGFCAGTYSRCDARVAAGVSNSECSYSFCAIFQALFFLMNIGAESFLVSDSNIYPLVVSRTFFQKNSKIKTKNSPSKNSWNHTWIKIQIRHEMCKV